MLFSYLVIRLKDDIRIIRQTFLRERLIIFVGVCRGPEYTTVWKVSKYCVISGPYFPVFELNMEIYGV